MADISKIVTPSGSSYNLKDSSAIASISTTSTGQISYTTRGGEKTELDSITSPIVITVNSNTMYITSTGSSLNVTVNTTETALEFTVVA